MSRLKGYEAEEKVKNYLLEKNYQFLNQNYYNPYGEIDLIMLKEEEIIFIEVKSYSFLDQSNLEYSINKTKQERIFKGALHFIVENPKYENYSYNFSVVLVEKDNIIIYDNCLEL